MPTITTPETVRWDRVFTWNGQPFSSTSSTTNNAAVRTGQKVQNWQSKIAAGQNATGPFVISAATIEGVTPGDATAAFRDPVAGGLSVTMGFTGHVSNVSYPTHISMSTSPAEAAALKQIYSKIRSEQSHLNGMTVVGELGSTIRMFRHPFTSLVNLTNGYLNRVESSARRLRGSRQKKRKDLDKIIADSYLEYGFGLIPLISDTRAIAEALARHHAEANGDANSRAKAVGSGKVSSSTSTTSTDLSFGTGATSYFVYRSTAVNETENTVRYVCGLDASRVVNTTSNGRLLQLLGFTPSNFIPTLWEVLPWSWLADYFINVQDIIEAGVTSTAGVTWICKTVRQSSVRRSINVVDSTATATRLLTYGWKGSGSGSMGGHVSRRTNLTRSIPPSLGMPPVVFSYADNARKLANMAAVLLQRRKPLTFN